MTRDDASRCFEPVDSPVIGSCETELDCHRSETLLPAEARNLVAAERARRADLVNVIIVIYTLLDLLKK